MNYYIINEENQADSCCCEGCQAEPDCTSFHMFMDDFSSLLAVSRASLLDAATRCPSNCLSIGSGCCYEVLM